MHKKIYPIRGSATCQWFSQLGIAHDHRLGSHTYNCVFEEPWYTHDILKFLSSGYGCGNIDYLRYLVSKLPYVHESFSVYLALKKQKSFYMNPYTLKAFLDQFMEMAGLDCHDSDETKNS